MLPHGSEAAGDAAYDLVAILIHKGSSASHGHYGMELQHLLIRESLYMPKQIATSNFDVHLLQS